jgi:hypothetical protein
MSEIKSKSPRTVEVKLLIPYAIITVMIIGLAGTIFGYNLHIEAANKAKADAREMVTSLVPKEQK